MDERQTWESSRLPVPLRVYNRVAGGAARLGWRTRLSASPIVERARRRTGLSDFGEGDVDEPLGVLVDSLEREARLTPFGRQCMQTALVETLCKRLRIVDHVKREAEVRQQKILRPLIVVGFPRTGTTLLQNLLAQDPASRPLLGWESFSPLPETHRRSGRRDPRIRRFEKFLRGVQYSSPEFQTVHEITAEGPAECNFLLGRTLVTWFYSLSNRVPAYEDWLYAQPQSVLEAAYRLHRDQLKILQHQRPGKRWLLKGPAHLNALHAIAAVYPDVCVVQTHRDLSKVHPSTCSLLALARGVLSDAIDARALGREALESGMRQLERMMRLRDELSAERVLDVRYADLMRDPVGAVRSIYDHFGLYWPEEMGARCRAWIDRNPRHKHGVHRYTLATFGTDREEIDRLAATYHRRFDVPLER
jgi:hypothetical protein